MLLTEMFGRGRAAPNIEPMDHVMTPDGPGVVVDSEQNRDGHYVWFIVAMDDGSSPQGLRHGNGRYFIDELKPIQDHGKATDYLNDAPDQTGKNIDDWA